MAFGDKGQDMCHKTAISAIQKCFQFRVWPMNNAISCNEEKSCLAFQFIYVSSYPIHYFLLNLANEVKPKRSLTLGVWRHFWGWMRSVGGCSQSTSGKQQCVS